ncbi:uncharacterized protein Bfra_010930 [Botrytis fragariae]|uniref:2EXR domain-containing protein n=1 Tax=Botrytis fragariae TaxID=1964551 RepID=A0A8H6EF95_9HELO|nr:uncharacterized protein Bfra_010930 [Botrytis fragariae]KAF5869730.1 hypothetical protein Bfra_010930 [Botrytis fragariae]
MAVTTLERFTCFPKLPLELQMIVWSFYPYVDRQIINITEAPEAVYGIGPYTNRSKTGDKLNPLAVDFPNAMFISVKYIVPSPLQICQQSRKVALQHYRRVIATYGDTKEGPAPFYINSYQDSILFEDTLAISPHSHLPTISFWMFNGRTLSTPDGENICTSVATRWAGSEPPNVDHLLYTLSRFPEVKQLYFLDCPSGPFPVSRWSNCNIQWMSRDKIKELVKQWIEILLDFTKDGTLSDCAPDSIDLKKRKGIFRSSWALPLISCITTEEFFSLRNTEAE